VPVSAAPTGAIVFTDIVGFTEFTDAHGDDVALALLERQEKIIRSVLPPSARVVKELGDGLLLWFDDAAAAVRTGLGVQQRCAAETADALPLWVRIGMHWGSPRRRGDDVVGRDVNLAARIVELAGPGEVLVSGAVADAAGPMGDVTFEALGPVVVRGFADAVPLLRAAPCA
jgi:adenylate cyclase